MFGLILVLSLSEVAALPEEILQPPHRPLQRVLGLVQDEGAEGAHGLLVGGRRQHLGKCYKKGSHHVCSKHLVDGLAKLLLCHFCPRHGQSDVGIDGLLHVDELVAVDGNTHQRGPEIRSSQ